MRIGWLGASLVWWITASVSCRTPAPVPVRATATPTLPTPPREGRPEIDLVDDAGDRGRVAIRLPSATTRTTTQPSVLPDAEADALLAALEPLPVDRGPAPVVRPPSARPPAPGTVRPIDFVRPGGTPIADSPMSNVRPPPPPPAPLPPPWITPHGEVRAASEIQIHFAEAMVPVAAVGKAIAPVATITTVAGTAIAGSWRWVDTQVAAFATMAARFPAATELAVEVPAGTRALNGSTLATAHRVTFATPPVTLSGVYPNDALRTDAPIVVAFDQPLDPASASLVRVERAGKPIATVPITLAEARARWARDPTFVFDPARLPPHHAILAPATTWPAGTELRVVLGKGARSTEGPRVATSESDAQFDTIGPFRLRGLSCDDMEQPRLANVRCAAKGYVSVELTNAIHAKTYRSAQIQIAGQPLDDHRPTGEVVGLGVPDEVGKAFAVEVSADLIDDHGQPLVGPRRIAFSTLPERFEPELDAPTGLYVLDPRFQIPQWVLDARAVASLRVQLFAVAPDDYFGFLAFERGKRAVPPGKQVYDHVFAIGARHGANARIDLRPALATAGTGHVIALATATPAQPKQTLTRRSAWIQVTRLGVTTRHDGDHANAWIHQISAAKFLAPQAGVATSLLVEGRTGTPSATTDADGHAGFDLMAPQKHVAGQRAPAALVVARTATDSVFSAIDTYARSVRTHDARWYVTDDRFTYKPGETVYVKGWIRWTHSGVDPTLALPSAGDTVAYTLNDRRGNKLASGSAPLTAQGGFDLELALPANANLGRAQLQLSSRGDSYAHDLAIEEFRTPTFAVTLDDDVRYSGARPLYAGEELELAASAKYYGGGGLAGARVRWTARLSPATYRPPGWEGYTFHPVREPSRRGDDPRVGTRTDEYATLDGSSSATAHVGIPAVPGGEPAVLEVDATVTDVDRQTLKASSRTIVVHPSAYYIGLRLAPSRDARADDAIQAIVTDVDGVPVAGVPIELAILGTLGSERDRDDAKILDAHACKLTSARRPVECAWRRHDDRTAYTARARVRDTRGRASAAELVVPWWAPDDAAREPDLAIIPDRALYRVGDTARLEIRSKSWPATAIVTVARQGILEQRRIALAAKSTAITVPIAASFIQNVHVTVDRFARRAGRPGDPLPEHASTSRELRVDVERLAVTARPSKPLVAPGGRATFEVEVRHAGRPVAGAEVALLAVDEAVLALSSKRHADPLAPFYFDVRAGHALITSIDLVRESTALAEPPGFRRFSLDLLGHAGRGGMRGRTASVPQVRIGQARAAGGKIESRKDFRATAVWSPRLTTDGNGRATVTVAMPDSLTRYRIVALAAADTRLFGMAESTIATRRALNVRAVAPRFVTQGDRFALPVIVQNLGPTPRTIDVAVRAANLVARGPRGQRVVVPPGERAELRFDFATARRGRVTIQTVARSGATTDASTIELPAYAPATTEAFATYGIVEERPAYQRLAVPADIFPEVGGVEIEVASTQLQSLIDAYHYLQAYPYECAEQRSGRMLATAAMADVLDAFAAPGRPTRQELAAQLAIDLERLERTQLDDGSWGYFADTRGDAFVTVQVLAALIAHHHTGRTTEAAARYVTALVTAELGRLEQLVRAPARVSDRDDAAYRIGLVAAALDVVRTAPSAVRLHAAATALDRLRPGAYSIDAKARVLGLLAGQDRYKQIRRELQGALLAASRESAATATIAAHYQDAERLLLVSTNKTTALVLAALMREVPQHPIIPKLARGLLEAQRGGRWQSTQENLAVLQAMRRYFDVYEKATPSFVGKLWLGDIAYAEQTFAGRTTTTRATTLPWTTVRPSSTHDIALQRTGAGRLYYRLGITYAPRQVDLPPRDAGFIVRRIYEGVDDPGDAVRTPNGHWRIKLGARVRVTIEAVSAVRRFEVALVDPLPAGLEPVNARLANAEDGAPARPDSAWDHTNLRDDRAEAFMLELAPGTHRRSYTARAATPGTFVAAPAKAEEMYHPETFGRSPGTVVEVE